MSVRPLLIGYDLTQWTATGNGPGFSTNDASVSTGLRDAELPEKV
jgi:hypothetical protein